MCPILKLGLFKTGNVARPFTIRAFRTMCNYTICSSHPAPPAHAICGGAMSKHSNYLNGFETKRLTITSNQITQF
jgi:hypothetical protein